MNCFFGMLILGSRLEVEPLLIEIKFGLLGLQKLDGLFREFMKELLI